MSEHEKTQRAQLKELAERECANYMDGQCVPKDRKCFIVQDGRICKWLQTCVLPLDRKRLMLVGNGKGLAEDPLLKRICRKCGETMTIRNNRQIYCAACSKENRLVKERERKRRAREKKRGSINFQVDNQKIYGRNVRWRILELSRMIDRSRRVILKADMSINRIFGREKNKYVE